MSYWDILGIDETNDLRSVKRAYAAKLKQTKPDEDPEGFKSLHAAYKWACQYARVHAAEKTAMAGGAAVDNDEAGSRTAPETPESTLTPVAYGSNSPLGESASEVLSVDLSGEGDTRPHDEREGEVDAPADEAAYDEAFAFLQAQWAELTALIDQVTGSIHTLNDLRAWQFLNEREALFDLQFKSEISHYTFDRMVTCLSEASGKRKLNKAVFDYLNSLFYWTERRDLLETDFGYEAVETVLQPLSKEWEHGIKWTSPKFHHGRLVYANYYARIVATVVDVTILFFAITFLHKVAREFVGESSGVERVFYAVAIYMLLSAIMEATPLQGTFGKILFGIKVVNRKGRRLNLLHAFFRSVLFAIATALIKITVWINLFSNDGRLIHDRLSLSIVVKR